MQIKEYYNSDPERNIMKDKRDFSLVRFDEYKEIFACSPIPEVRDMTGLGSAGFDFICSSKNAGNAETYRNCLTGIDSWNVPEPGLKTDEARKAFVRNLVNDGWEDGAEKCKSLAAKVLLKTPEIDRMKFATNKYCGQRLNVNKYLSGSASCFSRTVIEPMTGPKRIMMLARIGVMNYQTQDVMFWRAAPILAAADFLENSGYSVAITAIGIVTTRAGWRKGEDAGIVASEIAIKDYQDPLNMAKAASIMCSATTFRNGMFYAYAAGRIHVDHGFGVDTGATLDMIDPDAYVQGSQERVIIPDVYNVANEAQAIIACQDIIDDAIGMNKEAEDEFA